MNNFEIFSNDCRSHARCGQLTTSHGTIQTPAFMPVGTSGAVKGINPKQIADTGASIILANAYHLMIRPGIENVEKLGGLHNFMGWNKPILTDSGGYQLFSLSRLTKIDDNGVEFANHIDGSKNYLNAELATEIQNRLGADIIMCFDECTGFDVDKKHLEQAVKRTISWASICKEVHKNPRQLLFGIVQGGIEAELRCQCAEELIKLDFDGYAIGGLSVGEGHEIMINTVSTTIPFLPDDKPHYLMGVGMPADIIAAVLAGVDMFDCVMPTRNGRNAFAFTENGPLRLRNSVHSDDCASIEADCDCYCCRNFSRAAIRHFFNIGEMLGPILASLHNLRFFQRLMAQIRQNIEKGGFSEWAAEKLKNYKNLYQQQQTLIEDD